MGKVLLAVVAVVASFMLVDSLTCNTCPFSVMGFCLSKGTQTCASNTSVCYSGQATFPALPSFSGFSSQGCSNANTTCNSTSSSTLLSVSYQVQINCCSTDKCNTITNGAPSTKITVSAAIAAAVLASAWGSML